MGIKIGENIKYLGGKFRIAKQIGAYLNGIIQDKQITNYIEPFCGSCWVTQEINPNIKRFASDIHPDLILLWKELQSGWIPPEIISEEQYQILKDMPPSALRGFSGFGCSFSGKWMGGYARCKTSPRNYCGEAKRTLLKKIKKLKNVEFYNYSYDFWHPSNCLIYCDPPYFGTTSYSGTDKFNYDNFYHWLGLVSKNNYVFISEYQMPTDFEVVLEIPTKTDMSNKNGEKEIRIEKLFKHKNGLK